MIVGASHAVMCGHNCECEARPSSPLTHRVSSRGPDAHSAGHGRAHGCVWTRCCVGRAENVDTEPSAGSRGVRRNSVSIGNPIWRDLGFVNQCTRPPREPVSPCLLAWTAPTGGHVCTCPRDRLSVSTGAPGVCIRRARAVSYARMCAMGARSVNRPAPSLDVREAHGLLRCMSNVACARQRQSARAEPSLGSLSGVVLSVSRAAIAAQRHVGPRLYRRGRPQVAMVEERGWWWERKKRD